MSGRIEGKNRKNWDIITPAVLNFSSLARAGNSSLSGSIIPMQPPNILLALVTHSAALGHMLFSRNLGPLHCVFTGRSKS